MKIIAKNTLPGTEDRPGRRRLRARKTARSDAMRACRYNRALSIGHRDLAIMRNPLQEQLLKAGLVNKTKAAQVVREQTKQRHSKSPAPAAASEQVDTQRLQAERAERDRLLAAERNAAARAAEQRAQVKQIVDAHKVKREGEIAYRFTDAGAIKSVLVNDALRAQLASGSLVIVRHGDSYELLPRAAAEKVYSRDPSMIVLDHARTDVSQIDSEDDAFYGQFEVPDDLIW
jgi:uncharacterized protein YaiL (DUF2058 family)